MQASANSTKNVLANAYHRFMQNRLVAEMPDIPDAVLERCAMVRSEEPQNGTAPHSRKVIPRQIAEHDRQQTTAGLALMRSLSAWAC